MNFQTQSNSSFSKIKFLEVISKIDFGRWGILIGIALVVVIAQIPFMVFHNHMDTGLHLTNQKIAQIFGLNYNSVLPFWWLSDVVGGWWLLLFDSYGMWGARLGGALCLGLTAAFTANTLFQMYKPNLMIMGAIFLTSLSLPNDIINYVSLPTLLYSIFCLYFLKLHLNPSKTINPAISGLVYVLLVFSRMPLVLVLFVPAAILLYCAIFDRSRFNLFLPAYLKMFGVIIFSFFAFGLLLQSKDLLRSYIFYQTPTPMHTASFLISTWFGHLFGKVPVLIFATAFTILVYYAIEKNKVKYFSYFIGCFFLFCVALVGFYIIFPDIKKVFLSVWPDCFDVFPMLISLSVLSAFLLKKSFGFDEMIIMMLGISWPLFLTIGSGMGLVGIWFMIGFLLCGQTVALLQRAGSFRNCKFPLFCLGTVVFLVIGGKGVKNLIYPIYTGKFPQSLKIDRFNGIFTTKENVECIESLIAELGKYANPGESILAEPYSFTIYYGSMTFPLGDHSCIFYLETPKFIQKLDQITAMSPPKAIIRPKIEGYMPEEIESKFLWPGSYCFIEEVKEKTKIYNEKITNAWNPKVVWSNQQYEILIPQNSFAE